MLKIRLGNQGDFRAAHDARFKKYCATGAYVGSYEELNPSEDPPGSELIIAEDENGTLAGTAMIAVFRSQEELLAFTTIKGGVETLNLEGPIIYFGRAVAVLPGAYKAVKAAMLDWAAGFALWGAIHPSHQVGINMEDGRALPTTERMGYDIFGPLDLSHLTFKGNAFLGVLPRRVEVNATFTVNLFASVAAKLRHENGVPAYRWFGPPPFEDLGRPLEDPAAP